MQLWKDAQVWMRARSPDETGIGAPSSLRGRRALYGYAAGLVVILALLFGPGLVAELRLRSLQQAGELGPLVVEPGEVRGVSLQKVVGARPAIYFAEGVPLEKVQWAREGLRISWQTAPQLTGLRQPGDESTLYLFADHDQYQTIGRRLWGQRFGQLGWETCAFLGALGAFGGPSTACDVGRVTTRESLVAALAHELTHQLVYAEYLRGSSVPQWFNEGLASYVENEVYAAQAPAVPTRGLGRANYVAHALRVHSYQPLDQIDWRTSDEEAAAYAYAHSELAVRRLVERFGMNAVADLVTKSGPKPFADTFAAVLHVSLPDFETDLEESLRTKLLAADPIFYWDDFTQPSGRWRRSWTDRTTDPTAYEDGEYVLRVTSESDPTQAVWNRFPFDDFEAEIEARLVAPVEDAMVFLDLRIQPDNSRYRLSVTPGTGHFALYEGRPTGARAVVDDAPSAAVQGGTATNRLGVRAEGADIVLLINGQEVGRAQTGALRDGRIGFGLTSPAGQPAEARFSNLVVVSVN
ncbi:MAG TPA: hypothetical protein VII06_28320 [Chloroflexota bacterium]|jgi:hypothetical protein